MNQRFKSDEEYFDYVRKYAQSNRIIFYLYTAAAILIGGLGASAVLDHFKITIPTQGQLLVIVGILAILAMNKLRKSGWLQRQEDKIVEKAKKRLEKTRKEFAEKGMEYFIIRTERDLKHVLYFCTFGFLIMITLMTLPEGMGIMQSSLISIIIGSVASIFFIKSKYFAQIMNFMMKKTREDYQEGYLYRNYE